MNGKAPAHVTFCTLCLRFVPHYFSTLFNHLPFQSNYLPLLFIFLYHHQRGAYKIHLQDSFILCFLFTLITLALIFSPYSPSTPYFLSSPPLILLTPAVIFSTFHTHSLIYLPSTVTFNLSSSYLFHLSRFLPIISPPPSLYNQCSNLITSLVTPDAHKLQSQGANYNLYHR